MAEPSPGEGGAPPRKPSARWLAVRWVGLALLLAATVVAVASGARRASPDGGQLFGCPMHAEVRWSHPGRCPICGMPLEEVSGRGARGGDGGSRAVAAAGATAIGDFYTAGRRAFAREVSAPAYTGPGAVVRAVLYRDVAAGLADGDRGWFHPARSPDRAIEVRLAGTAAETVDSETVRVAFRWAGDDPQLPDATVGRVRLDRPPGPVLAIPDDAVVRSPEGEHVYIYLAGSEGAYQRRAIGVGRVFNGMATVVSGLAAGERVVVGSSFLIEAERRAAAPAATPPSSPGAP